MISKHCFIFSFKWLGVQTFHKIFKIFVGELGVFVESQIEIVDISLVVLAVVDFHGFGVDEWLEGVVFVGKLGKGIFHKLSIDLDLCVVKNVYWKGTSLTLVEYL